MDEKNKLYADDYSLHNNVNFEKMYYMRNFYKTQDELNRLKKMYQDLLEEHNKLKNNYDYFENCPIQ